MTDKENHRMNEVDLYHLSDGIYYDPHTETVRVDPKATPTGTVRDACDEAITRLATKTSTWHNLAIANEMVAEGFRQAGLHSTADSIMSQYREGCVRW